VRSVLAVIVALVTMAVLVLVVSQLPWHILGVEAVLHPGRFDTTTIFDVYAVIVAALGGVYGGWVCGRISRSWTAVIVLAALSFAGGTANVVGHALKPVPGPRGPGVTVFEAVGQRKEPYWFTILMPCLGVPCILLGGLRALRDQGEAKEYVTEAIIDASPELVWRILVDSDGYANWNPEIVGLLGRIALNERIKAQVKVGGGAIRTVPLQVTAFEPPVRMEWTGGLPLGLFIGRRNLTVTPHSDGAKFRMHLHMSGPLTAMILKSVGDRQPEIDGFSAALKTHAEATPSAG
jgi:uncharacterized protein YndB with AHSA1/START domain